MKLVDIQENTRDIIELTFESEYDNHEIMTLNIKKSDAQWIGEFVNE